MNGACAKCTGNTIKTNVGNTSDCNTDPACDGTLKIPNDLHNDCGNLFLRSNIVQHLF